MDQVSAKRIHRRVLVVDDERPIREVIAEALRESGYEVETAPNGAAALARLRRRPDVVVLDLMMPVMDAVAFTRRLRVHPHGADVPIVVLTAAYPAHEAAAGLGAMACLPKPFQLDELLDTVERAIA
jgi:two-component system, chemotaxis family, chemotaxis protein CheY